MASANGTIAVVESTSSDNDFSCKCGHIDLNHCLPDRPSSCPPAYLIDPDYGDFRGAYEQTIFQPFHERVSQLLDILARQQQQQNEAWKHMVRDRAYRTAVDPVKRKGKRRHEEDGDGNTESLDCTSRSKRRVRGKRVACVAAQTGNLDKRQQEESQDSDGEHQDGLRKGWEQKKAEYIGHKQARKKM